MEDAPAGFNAYRLHVSLKSHLTGSYDYMKYKGEMPTLTVEKFCRLPYTWAYKRIDSKCDSVSGFFLSNLVWNPKAGVVEMSSESEYFDRYLAWKTRMGSMPTHFNNDLNYLFSKHTPEAAFSANYGSSPIFNAMMLGKVSVETVAILDYFYNIFAAWDSTGQEKHPLWETWQHRLRKYTMLLNIQDQPADWYLSQMQEMAPQIQRFESVALPEKKRRGRKSESEKQFEEAPKVKTVKTRKTKKKEVVPDYVKEFRDV